MPTRKGLAERIKRLNICTFKTELKYNMVYFYEKKEKKKLIFIFRYLRSSESVYYIASCSEFTDFDDQRAGAFFLMKTG